MKITGLDGKKYTWSLREYVGKERVNCSSGHERTRKFLHEIYPALQILEEVFLPGWRLYLDFFIPVMKIAVEFQGSQHILDNRFFFKNKLEFNRAKARDNSKAEFCRINGLRLVYFYDGENEEQWKMKMDLS